MKFLMMTDLRAAKEMLSLTSDGGLDHVTVNTYAPSYQGSSGIRQLFLSRLYGAMNGCVSRDGKVGEDDRLLLEYVDAGVSKCIVLGICVSKQIINGIE